MNQLEKETIRILDDIFIVYLTVDGTSYEDRLIEIRDPNASIRKLIEGIVKQFELPKLDNGGNPIQYLLGIIFEEGDEPEILEFEDEEGREQAIIDYNVQPGDHIHLVSVPIAGGGYVTYEPQTRHPSFLKRIVDSLSLARHTIYSSVFAPCEIKCGSHMLIQVFLHLDSETEAISRIASEADEWASRRGYQPLQLKLKKGELIEVECKIYARHNLYNVQKTLRWQGSFVKCSFDYFVTDKIDSHQLSCEIRLSKDGVPLGEMTFLTYIVDYANGHLNAEIKTKTFERIFISYAHQDSEQVKKIALAYKAQGVDYFFDRDKLGGGDVYEEKIFDFIDHADLFLLCWSQNAERSEYVTKELKRAMTHAYPQLSRQEATLKIYPVSIEPRAPYPSSIQKIYNVVEI